MFITYRFPWRECAGLTKVIVVQNGVKNNVNDQARSSEKFSGASVSAETTTNLRESV